MAAEEKKTTLLNKQDLTGVIYVNTNLEFRSVAIISAPANWLEHNKCFLGQVETRLYRGLEPICFNHVHICSSTVVPMREPHTKELGLLYNASVVITANNCKYWLDVDIDKNFPGNMELRLAVIPAVIPYRSGVEIPHSIEDLITSLKNLPSPLTGHSMVGRAVDSVRSNLGVEFLNRNLSIIINDYTVNSEEKMAGSHITKFHTHKDEQPSIADLLSQEDKNCDKQHD